MSKTEIRRWIKARKFELSEEERVDQAQAVYAKIERTAAFRLAEKILLYNALPDELPTRDFIVKWTGCKQIFLPRVCGDDLEILPYRSDNLRSGAFQIEEPQGDDVVAASAMDLIIVPAVALDRDRNRLGRGKGFYDRLLAKTRATTIGIGYDFQVIPAGIPTEPHDVKLDVVITKNHTIQ